MSDQNENLRQDMADEISGILVGTGFELTTIGISAALEAADALIAAGYGKLPAADAERQARAEGWSRAIRDIKARLETLQPGETTLDHSAIREMKAITRSLPNPYEKEATA